VLGSGARPHKLKTRIFINEQSIIGMANYEEILTEAEKDFFDKVNKCTSIEEKLQLMQEERGLLESTEEVEFPFVDMSFEEYVQKYNLVIRDDFE
jgi:hypothetical protein